MGSEDQLQLELDDVMAKRQHLILVLSCQGRWQEHYYPRRRESKNLPCLTAQVTLEYTGVPNLLIRVGPCASKKIL